MAQILPIQIARRGSPRVQRHHRSHPVRADRLVFPTANGEDQVAVLPASGGGPWVWVQVRSIHGEAMQHAEVLLNRRQLRSILRLLGRAARRLDQLPSPTAHALEVAYFDEMGWRAAEEHDEVEREGVELPEDF